jgi:hypothetical protein
MENKLSNMHSVHKTTRVPTSNMVGEVHAGPKEYKNKQNKNKLRGP